MLKTKQSKSTFITVVITFFIIMISAVSTKAASESSRIEEIIKHKLNVEKNAIGVAVVVIDGDKTNFITAGTIGQQAQKEITRDSLFEIGSITKTFTSVALASMVKEGKVKLSDPVQKYMPENVTMPIKNSKPITLRSLANHSSGLPRLANNMPFADPQDPYADYTVELMYEFLNGYTLPREVGAVREYSNLAVGLLGHVLALIDGKSYEQVINDRVLKPLNMSNTFIHVPEAQQSNLSLGHNEAMKQTKAWQLPSLAAAGALKSNINDMTTYLQANMSGNPLSEELNLTHLKTANFGAPGMDIKNRQGQSVYLA